MLHENTTLGLRLDPALSRQLDRFAATTRRSKSDVARDALRAYLDRSSADEELRRELSAIAAATLEEDLVLLDAIHDDTMRDEPAYRWADRTA